MEAATLARLMASVPERTARKHGGAPFAPHAEASAELKHLAAFLHWLSPLNALSRDEQRSLGLLSPHHKPAADEDEDAAEGKMRYAPI